MDRDEMIDQVELELEKLELVEIAPDYWVER